jgi:hypothetical protein
MANIEKKSFKELSDVARTIYKVVNAQLDNNPLPIIIFDLDATVDELVEGAKVIIDTGWFGTDPIYIRRMEYTDEYAEPAVGVYITDDEKDFEMNEENGFYYYPKHFPMIIATDKTYEDDTKGFTNYIHDGDILLKTIDGKIVTKSEWDELNHNKTK